MADQQFCLRWNNHQSTLISVFDSLLENNVLVDCTLAAEGQYIKAHKVVLCACSPYLELLLSQHYEKHPIVILKDVKFQELKSMMDYMYKGEVNISQDQLGTFLKAAESLQIKGLTDGSEDSRDTSTTQPPKRHEPQRKVQHSQPRSPAILPHTSNLTIEPSTSRRVPPHMADIPPDSPIRSREGSLSPTPRKRRRVRRPSQSGGVDDSDQHFDDSHATQSTPVPTHLLSSTSTSISKMSSHDDESLDAAELNRMAEAGLMKEKTEPQSDILIEPKTEYLDDQNNDDNVEDLTLDDDDDMEGMDMSAGPSHSGDNSNQGYGWAMGGDRSDEMYMSQDVSGNQRGDNQGKLDLAKIVRRMYRKSGLCRFGRVVGSVELGCEG